VGPRPAEVDRRGFTLLEVLVVLFVIALVVSLTAPTISRSTEMIRARAEVAGFSALLRFAREQAITLREPQSVVVDPAEHRMALVAADGEVRRTRLLPPKWTIEANPPTHLSVTFEPEGSSSGGEFRIATSGAIYRVTVEPMTGRVRSARE
jgi:prepilin-type N-terminal cleavage/methylation domain-containing protein